MHVETFPIDDINGAARVKGPIPAMQLKCIRPLHRQFARHVGRCNTVDTYYTTSRKFINLIKSGFVVPFMQ